MSLAYKLWKIGSVLTKGDIKKALQEIPKNKDGKEPIYLNIDFEFKKNELVIISLKKDAVSKDKFFFSKKIGGFGQGIYYLYPNIIILNNFPIEKILFLENSLKKSIRLSCNQDLIKEVNIICSEINNIKNHINENKKISKVLKEISILPKGYYWIWFSVNGKTFYEIMPEVFDNWFNNPFIKDDEIKNGFDVFTNNETEVGYKPDVKVFSYDQYHDSLKYRVIENLPLSLKSAKNIKFAWMYILEYLVFYYKGLEYIIIPNLLTNDDKIYKTILERLIKANINSKGKGIVLKELRKEEDKLKKNIEKSKNDNEELEKDLKNILVKINTTEKGFIQEAYEQLLTIEEQFNSITIDYIFTSIDKKNLSFEIKGSIEDVIPSQMGNVVTLMNKGDIDDLIKLGKRDWDKILLQDFFNRDELYFIKKDMLYKEKKFEIKNKIFEERLYLAKLLLTDIKIKSNDLLKRIEFNRLYNYEKKKRVDEKDKVQEWIKYSSEFISKENNLTKFLNELNKIKE